MKQRLLIIVLALVLAAIGTSGVLAYAHGADARAVTGMEAVSVLVAQKQIPSGTSAGAALKGGLLAAEKLPASSVPSDAVRSVIPALSPLVMSAAVQPGQLLLRAMLVKTVAAATPGGVTLPPGMIEVTLHLCLSEAVAGAVQAGSEVAVFDTVVQGSSGASGEAGGSEGDEQRRGASPPGGPGRARGVPPGGECEVGGDGAPSRQWAGQSREDRVVLGVGQF